MYFDLLTVTSQQEIMDSEIWLLTWRTPGLFFFSTSLNISCVTRLLKDTQNSIMSLCQAWWLHHCLAMSAGANVGLCTKPVLLSEVLDVHSRAHRDMQICRSPISSSGGCGVNPVLQYTEVSGQDLLNNWQVCPEV